MVRFTRVGISRRHQFGTDGSGVPSGNNCEMLVIQGGNKINHSRVVERS